MDPQLQNFATIMMQMMQKQHENQIHMLNEFMRATGTTTTAGATTTTRTPPGLEALTAATANPSSPPPPTYYSKAGFSPTQPMTPVEQQIRMIMDRSAADFHKAIWRYIRARKQVQKAEADSEYFNDEHNGTRYPSGMKPMRTNESQKELD